MSRPNLRRPNFATDPVYTSGQDVTLPTCVDPGAASTQGILPGRLAPEHFNFAMRNVEQLSAYLDGINIQNFTPPTDTGNTTTGTIDDDCDMVWSDTRGAVYTVCGTAAASREGRNWSSLSGPSGETNVCALDGGRMLACGGSSFRTLTAGSNVWNANTALTATTFIQCATGRNRGINGQFVIGGSVFGASFRPELYTITGNTTFTAAGLTVPSGYQTAARNGPNLIAVAGGTFPAPIIAVANEVSSGGGQDLAVWVNDTSGFPGWALHRISSPSVQTATVLFWEPKYGFTLITPAGALYSSVDGITWALRLTFGIVKGAWAFNGANNQPFIPRKGCLDVDDTGGMLVAVHDTDGLAYWSADQGATWDRIIESGDDITGSVTKIVRVRWLGPKWGLLIAANNGGNFHHWIALSLALPYVFGAIT